MLRLTILLTIVALQCLGTYGQCDETCVKRIIDEEWELKKQSYIDEALDSIDLGEEFKKLTNISIGGAIAILVVIILVPNLVIMAFIFLCCWCCPCGLFHPKKETTSNYNYSAGQIPAMKPQGPAVPPRPTGNQSSGMWPWGKEDQGNNVQGQGVQNRAYNGQW